MEPRIGHWHCRYRLIGTTGEAALAAARLEREVRPRVSEAYADVLAQAFANDPAVYVLRRVKVRLALNGALAESEVALARQWADRIGSAVVRCVAGDDDHSGNLVRFLDEPDYVAHFILDLLNDAAWQRWYYGAFSKYRGQPKKEAILALLNERRADLAAIFRRLQNLNSLDRVLALIDGSAASRLWSDAAQTSGEPYTAEAYRLFVRSALRILELLSVWSASAPAESTLLEEYLHSRPLLPDWTDRRSLAAAVLNVIRYAIGRRYVSGLNREAAERFSQIAEQIASEFDWLDTEWLNDTLLAWLAEALPGQAPATLPSRHPTATPLHRQIVERLRDLLRSGAVVIDLTEATAAINALRLYAALAVADSELASHAAVRALIDHLLACACLIAEASDSQLMLAAMRKGDAASALASMPGKVQDAIRNLSAHGPAAVEALEEIIKASAARPPQAAGRRLPSECAGLFLLARAVIEARIPQLAEVAGAGPLSSVLLAIGLVWMGGRGLRGAMTDPGLALWCGFAAEEHSVAEQLSALDAAGCERLLAKVQELFEDRASLDSSLDPAVPESGLAELTNDLPPDISIADSLTRVAVYAFKLWARWLPGLSQSSPLYLLRNLVRRAGVLVISDDRLDVLLKPGAMDVVLEMASYTKELSEVTWLGGRQVSFRTNRSLT
jgi:hypothetical protein